MIKLSLNSSEAAAAQIAPQNAFANTLAAAVEAAGATPTQVKSTPAAKKSVKQVRTPMPSNGLLSRGVRWLQSGGRSKKRLHMIETVSLGDKRFVALVKVDGREFLLGGAPSSVGMLADLGAHGLGDLLSAAALTDTSVTEVAAATEPVKAPVQAAPLAKVAVSAHPAAIVAEPVIEPMTFELPAPVATAATTAAKLNVTVEADEDESDWLVQNDIDLAPALVAQPKPTVMPKAVVDPVIEAKSVAPAYVPPVEEILAPAPVKKLEPLQTKAVEVNEPTKAAPVASTSTTNPFGMNFTFQMWGAPQATAPVAPVAPTPIAGPIAVPSLPKAKPGIDLENSPELLGDPYLLALVEKTRGAAA